jgi:putative transposase
VDDLVAALGGCHVSKSEVSRICQELDLELALFRDRPLDDAQYPYVWFDATYEKVRQGGRIVSQAVVVAMAIRESGEKCVLGVAVGASETEAFLAGVLPLPGGQGTLRGAAGDLGRP